MFHKLHAAYGLSKKLIIALILNILIAIISALSCLIAAIMPNVMPVNQEMVEIVIIISFFILLIYGFVFLGIYVLAIREANAKIIADFIKDKQELK